MPTIQIYDKSQVDALIASAGGLPDPTSASAGDVLTLDSNKDPGWAPVPDELPSTASASAGDVLALDSNKDPAWVAPSGGSEWEEVNLSNFPTDWANGDIVRYVRSFYLGVNASGTVTLQPENLTTRMDGGVIDEVMIGSGYPQSRITLFACAIDSSSVYHKAWVNMEPTGVNSWNMSGGSLFNFSGAMDNTPLQTSYFTSKPTTANVATWIRKMWRKKA